MNSSHVTFVVSVCKDTKLLKAIHNLATGGVTPLEVVSVCKDTKLLKAIHNKHLIYKKNITCKLSFEKMHKTAENR